MTKNNKINLINPKFLKIQSQNLKKKELKLNKNTK